MTDYGTFTSIVFGLLALAVLLSVGFVVLVILGNAQHEQHTRLTGYDDPEPHRPLWR